jgi:hypothetical protein
VPLLVQTRGAEIGMRSQAIRNYTTTMALWQLHLDSELEFADDINTTVPIRPSDRYGFEWSNTYRFSNWFTLNADYTWSHGRLLGVDPTIFANHIPDAITTTFSGGPSVVLPNGLFANLRYRYWGPRYLIEDASGTSNATNYFELATGYQTPRYKLEADFLNLFNANGHDIDFFFPSSYPLGNQAFNNVNDIHFKPLQPFQARFSVTLRW